MAKPNPVVILGGATIGSEEVQRVQDAMNLLARDNHAPREITVTATLHVHHEYPKHVTVAKDKDGEPITKVVNSPEEEAGLVSVPLPPGATAFSNPKPEKTYPATPEKTWPKK